MGAAFKQKADKLTYTNEQIYLNYYYQYKWNTKKIFNINSEQLNKMQCF